MACHSICTFPKLSERDNNDAVPFSGKFLVGQRLVWSTIWKGATLRDGKSATIWDKWFEESPNRFFNQVGPQDTSTFYDNFRSDIQLMKQLNHNTFRTSIAWARLIPNGTGDVNPLAVKFYNEMIDELLKNGIEPFINLFHFDMPLCMQEKGAGKAVRLLRLMLTLRRPVSVCLVVR